MVIFSLLALLAFAACGGGDDDDDSGGDNTATATQDSGGDGGDDGGDATQEPTDGGDDGGNGDDSDPFAILDEFAEGLDQVTAKVSYEITDVDGDVTTMTLFSDPPNSRYDTTDEDGVTTTLIYTETVFYTCDSATEACFSYTDDLGGGLGLGAIVGLFGASSIGLYAAAAEAAGVDVDTSSEEHAGQDSDCFAWSDDSEGDAFTGKFCFGESGVMLYQELTDSEGTTKTEATDFSDDVSDSDFEPPYDVTTLPGQ
jgi:hypothetical protein